MLIGSLQVGYSGLMGQQTRLDAIGHDLTNVNTSGYRGTSVSFENTLAQSVKGGNTIGENPFQINHGTNINAMSTVNKQGAILSTGRVGDIAIDGRGFLVAQTPEGTRYTRDGGLFLNAPDATGASTLSQRSTSAAILGVNWDSTTGALPSLTGIVAADLEPISFTIGALEPARATTTTSIIGNIPRDGGIAQEGTQLSSNPWFTNYADALLGDGNGGAIDVNGRLETTATLAIGDNVYINDSTNKDVFKISADLGGGIYEIEGSETFLSIGNVKLNVPATTNDVITEVLNSKNQLLMKDGNSILMQAVLGEETEISETFSNPTATLGTFTTWMGERLGLSDTAVSAGTTFGAPNSGSLNVQGNRGEVNDITTLMLKSGDISENFVKVSSADGLSVSTETQVFDESGVEHNVRMSVVRTGTASTGDAIWSWTAQTSDASTDNIGVGSGTVTMNEFGDITSGQAGSVSVPLGATTLTYALDFSTLTGFAGDETLLQSGQDGYSSSNLEGWSVGSSGEIIGSFSNGMKRSLAQVAMASFINESGLVRSGDSLWSTGVASGTPSLGASGTGNRGSIMDRSLEASNVSSEESMTGLILTQRSYQSNARVITTSDEMLQNIIQLKR